MKELYGFIGEAALFTAIITTFGVADGWAKGVARAHIPYGHCLKAVGYEYDEYCYPNKELYQYRTNVVRY